MNCSICGRDNLSNNSYTGSNTESVKLLPGHNAEPINAGRCCNDCNLLSVTPARVSGKYFQAVDAKIRVGDEPSSLPMTTLERHLHQIFATGITYCAYVVDTALSADRIHGRQGGAPLSKLLNHRDIDKFKLVGWQCGFEPMFIAVVDYLDGEHGELSDEEAEELATDYLEEINWFSDGPTDADYILSGNVAVVK